MLGPEFAKMSQKAQEALGLPDGIKFFSNYPFDGMDQSASRVGIADKDCWVLENFIRLGDGNYRTLPDVGTALYTAVSKTIISFYFYNIGASNYAIIFFNDGTAVQVDSSTGNVTTVSASANTFYNSGISTQLPGCSQWGSQYLLIGNNLNSNCYWVWDGSSLYTAGTLSPNIVLTSGGSAYTSTPTITAYGGSGSSAMFSSVVSAGSVVSIKMTNAGTGYQPGDVVQLYITGGGTDSSAQLTAALTSGAVTGVVISNPGSGYSAGTYALGFSGGGGSSAAGTYTVAGGMVTGTTITAGGSGYTSAPSVSFPSGGGSNAAGVAVITSNAVASVAVTHGGSGFTGTPTLSFLGGGGSGATATAVMSGGAISSVTVTAGGSGYTSAPAVVVQTGQNRAASASLSLMPYGVSGSAIETYQGRVWIFHPYQAGTTPTGGSFLVSSPGSFSVFATSAGGLVYYSTDAFLRAQYTSGKQSNGYMYPIGDSSISVISNVQTTVNSTTLVSTTTFNYQNTDPQIGTSWRDTLAPFSRTVLFGNPLGVFGLYGGAVSKVSNKIDQVFTNSIFPPAASALTPSSAVATVYSKRVYLQLMTFKDPSTLVNVNKMVGWDEKDWLFVSQSPNLIYIGTQEVNSTITAWGTDGAALYPLLTTPSTSITKKLSSKLYGVDSAIIKKRAYIFMFQGQDQSASQAGISLSVTIDTNFNNPTTGLSSYSIPTPISFAANPPTYPMYSTYAGDVYGMNLGYTLTSTSPDFTINFIGLGYSNEVAELGVEGG